MENMTFHLFYLDHDLMILLLKSDLDTGKMYLYFENKNSQLKLFQIELKLFF